MKDWRGNEIEVGSRVLYAATWGRSAMMVEGVVTEILPDGARVKVQRERMTGGSSKRPVEYPESYDGKNKPVILSYGYKATVIS